MKEKIKLEDFQKDLDEKNYDAVYEKLVDISLKLVEEIIKKKNIKLQKKSKGRDYLYDIEYAFERQSATFQSVKYLMRFFLEWGIDYEDDPLYHTPEEVLESCVREYNRIISELNQYEKIEEEIKEKGYEKIKDEKIQKLIALFKKMMEYKNKKYDENWTFEKWIEEINMCYHYYNDSLMETLNQVKYGSIDREVEADYEEVIATDEVENIMCLEDLYYELNYPDGDYKHFANFYREFELKEGQTYEDLYNLEKEKFVKLFKEMLDFVNVKYDTDDFYKLRSLVKEAYPYYYEIFKTWNVSSSMPKTTYIKELNYMEDIYNNFSKTYKNHEENMKKYKKEWEEIEKNSELYEEFKELEELYSTNKNDESKDKTNHKDDFTLGLENITQEDIDKEKNFNKDLYDIDNGEDELEEDTEEPKKSLKDKIKDRFKNSATYQVYCLFFGDKDDEEDMDDIDDYIEEGDFYWGEDADENYGLPISKGTAYEIATRNINLKSDFCRAKKYLYTYLGFKKVKIDLIELDNKKYWQIQVLAGDTAGSDYDRKYDEVTDWDGVLADEDFPLLRCLVDAETGEYIYYPDKERYKKMKHRRWMFWKKDKDEDDEI